MATNVSVYPNPFETALSLEVFVEENEETIVRMVNNDQKIIKMLSWNLQKGTNKTSWDDLGSLPAGNYFVEIRNMEGKNMFSTKLIKK
jgi:hypothetical protein